MTEKKKPTPAQVRARKLFAERAKAGTLKGGKVKVTKARKVNPAAKPACKTNPDDARYVISTAVENDAGAAKIYFKNYDLKRGIPVFDDEKGKGRVYLGLIDAKFAILNLKDFWHKEMVGNPPTFKAEKLGK